MLAGYMAQTHVTHISCLACMLSYVNAKMCTGTLLSLSLFFFLSPSLEILNKTSLYFGGRIEAADMVWKISTPCPFADAIFLCIFKPGFPNAYSLLSIDQLIHSHNFNYFVWPPYNWVRNLMRWRDNGLQLWTKLSMLSMTGIEYLLEGRQAGKAENGKNPRIMIQISC